MYDLIIIGGGPAGAGACVYAARKQLKTLSIVAEWGGQSSVSVEIYNWIGTKAIAGAELAKNLKEHAESYKGEFLDIKEGNFVKNISKEGSVFKVELDNGEVFEARSVLIASGSGRRKLEAKNADIFEHKGLTYCATCDGPVFAGLDVAVIGGGNAGFESALQLLAYCKSVTLIHRSNEFRADAVTVEKTLANPNMRAIKNADILEVTGEQFVNGIKIKHKDTGEEETLSVGGIFVEIGQIPNTDLAKDVVSLDEWKKIIVDPMTQAASTEGIWAAGDCTNGRYHQNNIAAGDAVKAIEDIYIYLQKN